MCLSGRRLLVQWLERCQNVSKGQLPSFVNTGVIQELMTMDQYLGKYN